VDCRVVDIDDGQTDKKIGEAGELILRGPQVMKGYHNNPEENKVALREGWLYTGDVVRMDEDGYFFIVDRKKSLIKVGGFQVWPNEKKYLNDTL
jgi:long-chain acyl-CoA synthetase